MLIVAGYLSPHGCTNFIGNEENRPQERLESILPSENSNLISSSRSFIHIEIPHFQQKPSRKMMSNTEVPVPGSTILAGRSLGEGPFAYKKCWKKWTSSRVASIYASILLMEEILRQLRLVVYPIFYRVLYIPGGAGFLPSTVSQETYTEYHRMLDEFLHQWQET